MDFIIHLCFVKQDRQNYLINANHPVEAATIALEKWQEVVYLPGQPRPVGVIVTQSGLEIFYRLMSNGSLKACSKNELNQFCTQSEDWANGSDPM